MAKIDAGKLLPQSNKSSIVAKTGTVRFSVPKYTKVADRNLKNENFDKEKEDNEEIIFKKKHDREVKRIESLVDNISTLLMSRKIFAQKKQRKEKIDAISKKRKEKESELEAKKSENGFDGPKIVRKVVGGGIIDSIWRFFLYTFLGAILNRTKDIIPGLLKVVGFIAGGAWKVLETVFGALFEGFVFFVDLGFKIHDTIRGTVQFLGGDTGVKVFDAFTSGLSTFLNTALIVGMTLASVGMMPDFGLGGGGGKGQRGAAPGSTPGRRPPAPGARPGRPPAPGARPGGPAARPGAQPLRGMPKPPRPGAPHGFPGAGRAAGKGASRFSSKFVPFIGPIIDFAIRTLVFGDSPGRAAAGAAGVAAGQALGGFLGGAIGGIAGSVVPILGNLLAGGAGALIGSVIGGFVGDAIGTTLYDMVFERSKTTKPKGRAEGGRVSRPVKPIARRSKRLRVPGEAKQKQKTEPGRDIGGKSVIQRLFPDTDTVGGDGGNRPVGLIGWAKSILGFAKDKEDRKAGVGNPYKALTETSEILKGIPIVGGIMGASIDIALGQKPSDLVYNQLGASIGAIIKASANRAASESLYKTISAFAAGGVVRPHENSTFADDGKLEETLSNSFKRMINLEAQTAIRNISGESKKYRDGSQRDGTGGGDSGEGDAAPGAPGGWPDQPGGAPGAPGAKPPAGGGMGGRRGARGGRAQPTSPKVPGVPGAKPPAAAGGGSGNIAVQLTANQRKALDILSKYESAGSGGYNAVNQIGIAGGRGTKGFSGDIRKMNQHGGRALTDMTVGEILALQAPSSMSDAEWIKKGRLHAVGRYQFIGNTLPGVVERAGIPKDAKFTKEVQDLLAVQYMKERGIGAWVGPSDKATEAERKIIEAARRDPVKFTRATAPKGGGGATKAGAATSAGGFDTGLRTGPAGRIGAGTEYHVDARFKSHLPLDQKIAMMDSMARAHAQSGYTMEFSGIGVAGKRWDPNMPREQKEAFAKQVLASHHSPRAGYQPFDYYVVKQSAKNRFDRSAEGSSIMAPVIPGGSYQIDEQPGGAGRFITFFDKEGNEVGKIMHGDTGIASPIQMGKRFNMPEIPPDQIAGDRKPGQEATLNGKPVVWDGKNWKPKSESKNILQKIADSLTPKASAAEKAPAAKPAAKPRAPGGPSSPARTQAARAAARPKPATKPAAKPAPKRAWYDPRGWVGKQDGGQINPVGTPPRKNFAPLQSHASYEKTGQSLMIQPIIVQRVVPVPLNQGGTTDFGPQSAGGVNSHGGNRNSLSRH